MDIKTPASGTFTNCRERRKFLFLLFYIGCTLFFCVFNNTTTKRLKRFNALASSNILLNNYALVFLRK
ncbi:hypothetical protein MSIMFI_03770 [Mycobacterium simulans]|nr:hypothetical protein MSIMFI_03770 [Mycobacterium simulans]